MSIENTDVAALKKTAAEILATAAESLTRQARTGRVLEAVPQNTFALEPAQSRAMVTACMALQNAAYAAAEKIHGFWEN